MTATPKKKYHIELSLTSLFLWALGFFLLLAWVFVLGIFVDRGFFSEGVKTLQELKGQVANIQALVTRKDSSELDVIKNVEKDPELAFYEKLSGKKEEVRRKIQPSVKKRLDKPRKPLQEGVVYAVQIASLDNEIKASAMVKRLLDRGYPAYSYRVIIKGKTYYRVRCGPFKNKEEAGKLKNLLAKKEKIKGFVARVEK